MRMSSSPFLFPRASPLSYSYVGLLGSFSAFPMDLSFINLVRSFSNQHFLQVFIAISLILGDGLYNLIKIIAITVKEICNKRTKQGSLPIVSEVLGKGYLLFFI